MSDKSLIEILQGAKPKVDENFLLRAAQIFQVVVDWLGEIHYFLTKKKDG